MAKFRQELKLAQELALQAGQMMKRASQKKIDIRMKGRVDLVTAIDLKIEKMIKRSIAKNFPTHDILAEESGISGSQSDYRWIIDPIDGTTNFAHGYPVYCVSIGVELDGEIVLGVIYNPNMDELFYAVRGNGAFLNRRRISVSSTLKLEQSLLATGFPYDIAESKITNLGNFGRMYKLSRGIRRGGSAAIDLAYTACGRFDGFWELKLKPWDMAAGVLLISEAGGKVTNFKGGRQSIYDSQLLATNGKIHKQMQKHLKIG